MNTEAYERIFPQIDDGNREYFEGLEAGELRLQRCDVDGTFRFPAAPVCPVCLSSASTWVPVSGEGTVWSWIVMHQRYFEAFEDQLPYNVVFVRLAEGPLMMSTAVNPEHLRIDAPVRLRIERMGGHAVPEFEVAAAAD